MRFDSAKARKNIMCAFLASTFFLSNADRPAAQEPYVGERLAGFRLGARRLRSAERLRRNGRLQDGKLTVANKVLEK